MADVTRTDDIAAARSADISKTKNVAPVKKVVRKKRPGSQRERQPGTENTDSKPDNEKKEHIDVYA